MRYNLAIFFMALVFTACTEGAPGFMPDASTDTSTAGGDNTADIENSSGDSVTPMAGTDIKLEAEVEETEDVSPDTALVCTKNADMEQTEACWNGLDDDCDGNTDQAGGDPDCAGYCQPADGVTCTDTNPETEDFCSPLSWTCKNLGCEEDCDDGNGCTADACVNGQCESNAIANCVPCTEEADCAYDGVNPLIPHYGYYCDLEAGSCAAVSDECATNADCEDGDPCTNDVCSPAYHAGGVLACGVLPPTGNCPE